MNRSCILGNIEDLMMEENKQGSVGAYIKQHIMSGLLNLSSIRGDAIYFASTHTSGRPHAHVLVTGSDSNGEFNCLGKKINKRYYAATLTTWYKGVILPQVPRISGLEPLPGFFPHHFTVERKPAKQICTSTQLILKAASSCAGLWERP